MKANKKIYEQWWFWAIVGLVFITIAASTGSTDCECPKTYETEYNTCLQDIDEIQTAWNDYMDAMADYCALDPYNNICIALG